MLPPKVELTDFDAQEARRRIEKIEELGELLPPKIGLGDFDVQEDRRRIEKIGVMVGLLSRVD